ncbi:hypothetical protein [Pusillimonas minor]|uniref:Uncharacterized protein n=1 Tax=Pusillimonas minor TaxID=2697024 RepID=A0A842HPN4_9BURK|nr:hypothetical protein [Pusillimonas minor]MBC2770899.1 hypothetical protein [Pusillimonas minor]
MKEMRWKNSKMTLVYYSQENSNVLPCDVRIDGEEIVVQYDSDGPVLYIGKDLGYGHYLVESFEEKGKASLHRAPNSQFMEGFWIEDGIRGMWRIELLE